MVDIYLDNMLFFPLEDCEVSMTKFKHDLVLIGFFMLSRDIDVFMERATCWQHDMKSCLCMHGDWYAGLPNWVGDFFYFFSLFPK